MPGFDSDVLAYMAATLLTTLDKTCTIKAKSVSNNATGWDENLSNRATGVACSLWPTGNVAAEKVIAGKVVNTSAWVVRLAASQVVDVTDQIVIGSRTFEVVEVVDASGGTIRPVICVEVL